MARGRWVPTSSDCARHSGRYRGLTSPAKTKIQEPNGARVLCSCPPGKALELGHAVNPIVLRALRVQTPSSPLSTHGTPHMSRHSKHPKFIAPRSTLFLREMCRGGTVLPCRSAASIEAASSTEDIIPCYRRNPGSKKTSTSPRS